MFVAAHALLRAALAKRAGLKPANIEITADAGKAPQITGPASHIVPSLLTPGAVSISHTSGCVAAAVSQRGRIGIDVEQCNRLSEDPIGFASRHFHTDESHAVRGAAAGDAAHLAIALWCLKEAFAKALGLGLRLPMDATAFSLDGTRVSARDLPGDISSADWCFSVSSLNFPSHVIAIAHEHGTEDIVPRNGAALLSGNA